MWECSKCKSDVDDNFEICWNCGADKERSISVNADVRTIASEVRADIEGKRHRPIVFKLLFYIILTIGILALINSLINSNFIFIRW